MVKKLFNFVCMMTFLMSIMGSSFAQDDFLVTSPLTDNNHNLLKPIQAGKSTTFEVKVTNNLSVYTLVSINTDVMGTVSSWASVDISNDTIRPGKTKAFNVTIAVPEGIATRNYDFLLALDAVDQNGTSRDYNYETLTLMVDNTPPSAPTFVVKSASKSVEVKSWESWDANSSFYDNSYGGIQRYKIMLRTPDGSIIGSNIIEASGNTSQTFTGLASNTNYKASVIAVDLAGNENTSEKDAPTAPAAPTSLSFSNTTYIGTTLSWAASDGATGYDIYKVAGSTDTKLNSGPVTGTSFAIGNLSPKTAYTFYAKALNNVGESDNSANVTVTTLALPLISGTNFLCSGSSTFTINNLLTGYSVLWLQSPNLRVQSQSGTSATFTVISSGPGWISASIVAPNKQVLALAKKDLWVGRPDENNINLMSHSHSFTPPINVKLNSTHSYYASLNGPNDYGDFKWAVYGGTANHSTGPYNVINYNLLGQASLRISRANSCGESPYISYTINVSRNGGDIGGGDPISGFLAVYPNPASSNTEISIKQSPENTRKMSAKSTSDYDVIISNVYGVPVFRGKINQDKINLNVSGWQKGNYFVKFVNAKEVYSAGFLVE